MKMKKRLCIVLVLVFALLYACKKEPIPPDNTFSFFYHFYNEGDTILKRVGVFCSTFYPKEELTSWISRDKGRDEYYYSPENLLHDFDSLIVETDIKTYPGCVYSYEVSLHYIDSTGSGRSKIYVKSGPINSQDDAYIKFYWPKDSILFTRIK